MGVYASFQSVPPGIMENPSTISYIIDQEPPTTLEITNPIMNGLSNITSQLIIQTPMLSQGPHSFQMTFIGPDKNVTPIILDRIITQAVNRNLDTVPGIGTSNSASQTSITSGPNQHPTTTIPNSDVTSAPEMSSGGHHLSSRAIVAISISVAVAILIFAGVLYFWHRRAIRKKLRDTVPNMDLIPSENQIVPFNTTREIGRDRFRIAEYTTKEKTAKYREAYGVPQQSSTAPVSQGDQMANNLLADSPNAVNVIQIIERHDQPQRPRYTVQVHQDRERIGNTESGLQDIDEVISLPPVYSRVGQTN